jgi:hypothetical protein
VVRLGRGAKRAHPKAAPQGPAPTTIETETKKKKKRKRKRRKRRRRRRRRGTKTKTKTAVPPPYMSPTASVGDTLVEHPPAGDGPPRSRDHTDPTLLGPHRQSAPAYTPTQ